MLNWPVYVKTSCVTATYNKLHNGFALTSQHKVLYNNWRRNVFECPERSNTNKEYTGATGVSAFKMCNSATNHLQGGVLDVAPLDVVGG